MFITAARDTLEAADKQSLFEGLLRDSHKKAYSLAYRLTGNATEAEDLVQESFVRAFRFFHKFDRSLSFSSWLYRIISNAHIDMVRKRGRIRTTSIHSTSEDATKAWDLPDLENSPDRELLENSLEPQIQSGLLSMNPEFRMAVLMADVEGLSYEEVAEIMGTSVGTVRSRIHRGRKHLKDYLLSHAPETYRSFCDEL